MVALYTACLPRLSLRGGSLSGGASSLDWRWCPVVHVVVSVGDDSIYGGVSALGDVTGKGNHLHGGMKWSHNTRPISRDHL